MANVSVRLGYKDSAWFAANASLVLLSGQVVFLDSNGTYKIGDGSTALSGLTFYGGAGGGVWGTITGTLSNQTDLQNALNAKQNTITTGATTEYFKGDLSLGTFASDVRATALTGLSVTGSTIVSTDTVLEAFGKAQNQINALLGGVNYQGTWNASTNTPSLSSGTGTKGYYYVVSNAGSTNLDGITDWKLGDWAIFNGTTWEKVDNTDAVISVNGYTGAVSLVKADIGLGNVENTALSTWAGSSNITTLGTIGTGVWNGSSISTTYTDAKIKTVTGTSNRITIGGTSTDPTFDISTSYVGQNTITTLGTIGTGVWQGTSIGTTYTDAKIKGSISATAGLIPHGTGTADTVTSSTNFKFSSGALSVVTAGQSPFGTGTLLHLESAANQQLQAVIYNSSTGTAASSRIYFAAGTMSSNLWAFGNGYTTSGYYQANTTMIEAISAKLSLATSGANPINFYTNGNNLRAYVPSGGGLVIGTGAGALATTATDGFLYIPSCAGTPTGTPTTQTGSNAVVYDTTNNKLYVYNGAWKSVTLA